MTNTRNNILAGIFVLAGAALAIWVAFLLADRSPFESTTRFTVRFPLASGAVGLKRGSSVTLGGQEIGRVLAVDFPRDPQQHPQGVDVLVEVRSDIALYENASVFLEKPILGTLSAINFTNPGTPESAAGMPTARLREGSVIAGKTAPPALLADSGLGAEQVSQIHQAIDSLGKAMRRLDEMTESSQPIVNDALREVRTLIEELRHRLAEWGTHVDTTLANVDRASARLDPLLDKAEAGLEEARQAAASLRALIDQNRTRVDDTLIHLRNVAERFDRETLSLLQDSLRTGRDALAVFSDAISRAGTLLTEETPSIRKTIANLRLMSDQLKLAAIEVRSQPWRLLHQPTTRELSAQVLYDAARAYAEASSDLRAAGESLQAAIAAPASASRSDLDELGARLAESMARYREAEQRLFDILLEQQRR